MKKAGMRARRALRLKAAVCLAPLVMTAACAAFPTMTTSIERGGDGSRLEGETTLPTVDGPAGSTATDRTPERLNVPGAARPTRTREPATEAQIAALVPDEMVDATLAPQPIPQFAATVFGGLLNLPYSLAGDVASRGEIVAGGTGGSISKRALFRLTQQALKQYGVDVYVDGAGVTIGNAEASSIGATVNRNRDVPNASGRVVQFFAVQTIEVNALQSLLSGLFPNLGGARITPDPLTNSLLISGSGRDVAQVVRVLRELDQPRFAGGQVLRVEPVYWPADQLAQSLEQVLKTEGYVVSLQAQAARAITILPFPQANQILIFTREPEALDRVNYWVGQLDRPAALGDKATTFVYQVRNTDATSLGELAMGQTPTTNQVQTPVGVPGAAPAQTPTVSLSDDGGQSSSRSQRGRSGGGSGQFMNGRLLTDPIGNRILFTGTATEYAQLRNLLTTLDIPAPQVVIEVMIAEVTLTDSTDIGVSLFGREQRGDGLLTGSTEGLSLGSGAGVFSFTGPDYRVRLVANATNDRVNILQRPQLVTRSGGVARFQVGTDVPIITSQRASDNTSNGDTDILQSVQYRQTGTILEIEPVVYGDRVDITISQELSSAGASPPGIASPTILNRSLTTQIAIKDGWTGVLGGLIDNQYSKVNTGIPFLKDIPIVGSAFQSNTVEGGRTELLLLITPYIVRGDEDMADFADQYANNMNAAFRTGRGWSYTLTPWSVGTSRFRGIGFDLPSPLPASETPPLIPRRGRPGIPQDIDGALEAAPAADAPTEPTVTVEPTPGA
ncbi:MAG: hypothetical protein DI552_13440 [Brevundimonas sp.]|nr:secretin N-terminal domain-containing protein [uncultured Brevundimonas sp.]PZU53792.1 MAG: hypothetical protein DI552_13440 [Brevundimonas sp.]